MLLLLLLTLDLARTLRGKSVLQLPPIIDRWERKTIPPMHAHEEEEEEEEAQEKLFFQSPECSPPSLNAEDRRRELLKTKRKASAEIARLARRDGKGRAKKTRARLLPTILPSFVTYLPTYKTYLPIFLASSILGILQASVGRE
jgi:hypothetical protein